MWRPVGSLQHGIPIQGVIRKYKHSPDYSALIGGAIASTNWFSSRFYRIDTEWKGGNAEGDKDPIDRMIETMEGSGQDKGCPIQVLDECVVSLSPPVVFYDDIQEGKTTAFRLPSIKDLEFRMRGYTVHLLGIHASPIEALT